MNAILVREVYETLVKEGGMLTPHQLGMCAGISSDKALACAKELKKQKKVTFEKKVIRCGFKNARRLVVMAV